MSKVVIIHGMNNDYRGVEQVLAGWLPALRDGMHLAGYAPIADKQVAVGFYGHIFRPPGGSYPQRRLDHRDVQTPEERALLKSYWDEAVAAGEDVPKPEDDTKSFMTDMTQRALLAVARTKFFKWLNDTDIIRSFVKEPVDYLTKPDIKQQVQDAVAAALTPETRVVVAHSLGSIVAYEMLTRQQTPWSVDTLLTLGSPLGIPTAVFERLTPAPVNGKGAFPNVKRWVNIADKDDFVAAHKQLDTLFSTPSRQVEDMFVVNGEGQKQIHSVAPYLSAKETGKVIAEGLGL